MNFSYVIAILHVQGRVVNHSLAGSLTTPRIVYHVIKSNLSLSFSLSVATPGINNPCTNRVDLKGWPITAPKLDTPFLSTGDFLNWTQLTDHTCIVCMFFFTLIVLIFQCLKLSVGQNFICHTNLQFLI